MGELKPIGSEKLKGDAKIKRILELTYHQPNEVIKESSEVVKETKSGVYGVVKEKDGYYVKKGLNENSLDYIGGMFMKNKNKFSSYAEALKKMEFLTEQENIQEATRYVLKQNKPAPAPAPATPTPAPSGEELPPEPNREMGDEDDEDPNDYMVSLKKAAGKLQQKLNKYAEQMESSDYTEILKQVLSAVDFDLLDDTDRDEILDEIGGSNEDVPAGEFPTDDGGELPPQETAEMDGVSLDGVASLDELINTPLSEYGDDDYYPEEDEDDLLNTFDDDFLNDPEIDKAGKVATTDLDKEFGSEDESGSEEEFPLYNPEKDVDEELPVSGASEEDVREIDLDELTNMVNNNVKQSLSKYFA